MGDYRMNNQTLLKLSTGELTKAQAYKALYSQPKIKRSRRAHFVKIRIIIPEERGVTRFLAFLFLLPMPLLFAKILLRKMNNAETNEIPISKDDLLRMISVKGIKLDVKTHTGEKIFIKTL